MSNRYIEASKRVIARAEQHPDRLNAPCSECKWKGAYSGGRDYQCDNPVTILGSETTTDAYARDRIRGIHEQRSTRSPYGEVVCGPEGVLWEPRAPGPFGLLASLFR